MNVVLFDDPVLKRSLLPFTFTRPVAGIRVGILTISEKWARWMGTGVSWQTEGYLQKKFPAKSTADNLMINGAVCPDQQLVDHLKNLPAGYFLIRGSFLIAARQPQGEMNERNTIQYPGELTVISKPWMIFRENAAQIRSDFRLITHGRTSAKITDPFTRTYRESDIFLEEGVELRAATLNAESGPIYLGKNSVVQEGAVIRGSFALLEGSQINMGAKVRGDTTIGPYSKIGGEISNSVVFGYSNKSHDGFLGNSVLGEWCNLGADTNASNMKNNYDTVKLWNHAEGNYEKTDLQFCGMMMGDHSKSGINTMFNTATVVDVCATVFGDGYPPTYIPSFSWGGGNQWETNQFEKAIVTAERAMGRRNVVMNVADKEILYHIFEQTRAHRSWEQKQ